MRIISAGEIKRRGISAVDPALQDGPVYVVKQNQPCYVILSVEQYEELLEDRETATIARVKAALSEAQTRQMRRSTAQDIIDEFGLED